MKQATTPLLGLPNFLSPLVLETYAFKKKKKHRKWGGVCPESKISGLLHDQGNSKGILAIMEANSDVATVVIGTKIPNMDQQKELNIFFFGATGNNSRATKMGLETIGV